MVEVPQKKMEKKDNAEGEGGNTPSVAIPAPPACESNTLDARLDNESFSGNDLVTHQLQQVKKIDHPPKEEIQQQQGSDVSKLQSPTSACRDILQTALQDDQSRAHERFEYRLKKKLEQGSNAPTDQSLISTEGDSAKASSQSSKDGKGQMHMLSQDIGFEYRLKKKLEQGSETSTKQSPKSSAGSSANTPLQSPDSRFEHRLKKKLEQGSNASTHREQALDSAEEVCIDTSTQSPDFGFEYRLKEKLEQGSKTSTKQSLKSAEWGSANNSLQSSKDDQNNSPNNGFECRLKEKITQGSESSECQPTKPSSDQDAGNNLATVSTMRDSFERRSGEHFDEPPQQEHSTPANINSLEADTTTSCGISLIEEISHENSMSQNNGTGQTALGDVNVGSQALHASVSFRSPEIDTDTEAQHLPRRQRFTRRRMFARERAQSSSTFQRISQMIMAAVGFDHLVEATLVVEDDEEVVIAEQVGYFENKWKAILCSTCLLLVALAVALPVTMTKKSDNALIQTVEEDAQSLCYPCINRSSYTLKAIIHGTSDDEFWQTLIPSARQAAQDMGVNLELELYPKGKGIDKLMAADIRAAADFDGRVHALIVTIPSKTVEIAVRYAADRGMPVFGMNSGFKAVSGSEGLIEEGSVKFFTAMDERLGGELAAGYFLEQFSVANVDNNDAKEGNSVAHTHALFISPSGELNTAYQERFDGYRARLKIESNNTIVVERFELGSSLTLLRQKLSSCLYQSVLVGSGHIAPTVAKLIKENGCLQFNISTKIGTFDSSSKINTLIANGEMDFALDQSSYLQGWAPVHFAALHVTTGLVLAPPPSGVYLSGPVLVTKNDSITNNACTDKSFKVCPEKNEINKVSSDCECIDRGNMTLGGVVHGTKGDEFWDAVLSGAKQGASDMGVQLIFDLFQPDEESENMYQLMATRILSLCNGGVNGLFVTLSDLVIIDAVRKCREFNPNVQVISNNAPSEISRYLDLIHHVGMEQKDAGYEAGQMMARMADFDKAFCINDNIGLSVSNERCAGFEQATKELGIDYFGMIEMTHNDIARFISKTEMEVGETGDWEGYGFLLTSVSILPAALELKKLHKYLVMGTFDTSDLLYQSLATGDALFGIDQQPYLEGYVPIPILVHAVSTGQSFLDQSIKSGPSFVTTPPTDKEATCKKKAFPTCGKEGAKSFITPFEEVPPQTDTPSLQPSFSPSIDLRPTLEIVQARGHVLCAFHPTTIESGEGLYINLCRAVASVVFGDPGKMMAVKSSFSTRFMQLHNKSVDLLLLGDTFTMEREIRERTTGSGLTFSSPYYYDGIVYFGDETFVRCAEEQKRYGGCDQLVICVIEKTTTYDFVQSSFPSDFFVVAPSFEGLSKMLLSGTCNVITEVLSYVVNIASSQKMKDRQYVIGDKMQTKEPQAVVTRNDDQEFSDIINWVVQALFYGEEQGLTKDLSLCQNYTAAPSHLSELNFLNAVYCVGNYVELLLHDESKGGMNRINNGTSGMLYAVPFGDLEHEKVGLVDIDRTGGTLWDYRTSGSSLKCGVVVPSNFSGNITASDKLVGMSADYCHTLAAALFNGNSEAVKISIFSEGEDVPFAALNDGTVDVLAGALIEQKYDFASSPLLQGFDFSTPYYYGNETAGHDVSFFSLATRGEDTMFTSFVNCVVLATIYAQEHGITSVESNAMPLMSIFGNELRWSLRDAISYSGSYDEIYTKHFGEVPEEDRGRNILNKNGDPQIHSFPGIKL